MYMAKRRIKYKNVVAAFLMFVVIFIATVFGCVVVYNNNLKAVNKDSKKIEFTVEKGETYQSLGASLEKK